MNRNEFIEKKNIMLCKINELNKEMIHLRASKFKKDGYKLKETWYIWSDDIVKKYE